MLALRCAEISVGVIVDVDAKFALKEFGEGRIREIEHVPTAHAERAVDVCEVDGAKFCHGADFTVLGFRAKVGRRKYPQFQFAQSRATVCCGGKRPQDINPCVADS